MKSGGNVYQALRVPGKESLGDNPCWCGEAGHGGILHWASTSEAPYSV